jgi:two-component system LytT family response regulator
MILTCAIIDDEPLAAELLESYAKKTPELHLVGVYGSAVEAMKELRNNPVDLLFLDIQMPELSGMEFAGILPKKTKIIFTTAFDRYAIDGYKVNAADYLLKPISYDSFVLSVNRVLERCKVVDRQDVMSADGFVYVKSEYKLVKINFVDILYIEGVKDYVKIYFRDRRKPVMSLMNMKKLEDYLPKSQFMRVHRSFIVNMSVADMIDRGRIVAGDTFIPVSESYKEQVQEYIDRHTLV